MDQKAILNKVRDFTDLSHGEQKRKYTPDRYIVHPERVMKALQDYTDNIAVLSAALLHDVLEDTLVTEKEMHDFLLTCMDEENASKTIGLVVELTDVYIKKDYPGWNRRKRKAMEMERSAKTSSEAQTIKYADIIDNCNEIVQHDRDFARVFLYECKKLLAAMDNGDPELYVKAKELVEDKIGELKKARQRHLPEN
jgi:guanosine-3',5'-bis(diphosphate) 3'-pyrophosphohydrolase